MKHLVDTSALTRILRRQASPELGQPGQPAYVCDRELLLSELEAEYRAG